jgi:LytR cell envelope-related transcriptional attenuator
VTNAPDEPQPPPKGPGERERPLPPIRAAIVLALFVVAVVLLLGVIHPTTTNSATGSTTPTTQSSTSTTTPPAHSSTTTTTTVPPSHVPVLVANASGVTGAAAAISSELAPGGWDLLAPVNASTDVPASHVYYLTGQQGSAATIASTLGIPAASVLPYSSAVPVSTIGTAQVVVVAGPDLKVSSTTTTTTAAG